MKRTIKQTQKEVVVLEYEEYEKLLSQAFHAGYETALSNHRYLKRNQISPRNKKEGREHV